MRQLLLKKFFKKHRSKPKIQCVPELFSVWANLIKEYYPERTDLLTYNITWSSRRQRRVLGSCNIKTHRVRIAREMQHPECAQFISPLIYHELCHAVLGDSLKRLEQRIPWHGKEFRELEARHPQSADLTNWIRSGGWAKAVRRARTSEIWRRRKAL